MEKVSGEELQYSRKKPSISIFMLMFYVLCLKQATTSLPKTIALSSSTLLKYIPNATIPCKACKAGVVS